MIEHIDIQNFGSFKDFVWSTSIRDSGNNVAKFKKLNIIYGRNYSGKTTLSRIFRSLQTGRLPDNYENPTFSVSTDSGTITQSQITTDDHHIRVYNRERGQVCLWPLLNWERGQVCLWPLLNGNKNIYGSMTKKVIPLPCGSQIQKKNMCVKKPVRK